jgi:prepilin-type processing-associated H-X9-DG protein
MKMKHGPHGFFSPNMRTPHQQKLHPLAATETSRAFTITELLVIVGIVCLLAMLHVMANSQTKGGSEASVCLGNLRRLNLAWTMFARDHMDRLPGNLDGGDAQNWANSNRTWCAGWLDNAFFRADNTNTTLLMHSQLGKYSQTPTIYKCPADRSLHRGRTGVPRVRSVSMNGYMGERGGPYTSGYRQFKRLPEIVDPTPARAFVFIDEREDTIGDAWFAIDMGSYAPDAPTERYIVDYPAAYHDRGANLSFADGHAEAWSWRDARTIPLLRLGQALPIGQFSPNNPDIRRLQDATSRRAPR